MSKPYRKWKVAIKEVGRELPIHTELHGPYDLDDVKEHFGLEEPDVEWYTINEKEGGAHHVKIKHKQHTDPDQSERLIKAGLDIDTADMHYRDGAYHQGKPDMNTMAVVAPIWSAYALRKLIPTKIRKDLNGTKIYYRIGWEPKQRGFVVFYVDDWWHSFTLVEFECEDLNDGYIDMMCWLLDNGYVEKKGGNDESDVH